MGNFVAVRTWLLTLVVSVAVQLLCVGLALLPLALTLYFAHWQLMTMVRDINADTAGRFVIDRFVALGDTIEHDTPERKRELHLAVRKILVGLQPVIEEVRDTPVNKTSH